MNLLGGAKADDTVWTADLSYWLSGHPDTVSKVNKTETSYVAFHRDLGVLPYYYYEKFWAFETKHDDSIRIETRSGRNAVRRIIRTPVGEIWEESQYLPESFCWGITNHYVSSEQDLETLLCLLDHTRYSPQNIDDYDKRTAMWSVYGGLPCLGLPRSPLPALCCEWMGIQNLSMLMMDAGKKVIEALARMDELEAPIIDGVCDLAPPLVHFPDNLSSENLAGFYDDFMRERYRRRIETLHQAGVRCAVHLDGSVRALLPKLARVGFDAVEALTPVPSGDITVDEMAGITQDTDVILWGGVPGAMFAPPYEWETMKQHVLHVLEAWEGRRFILGVADQVPPNGNLEYCKKISELLRG